MAKRTPKGRFDLFSIGTRLSTTYLYSRELSWWCDLDETVLGTVILDLVDQDYGWILLARDEGRRFRCVKVGVSKATERLAEGELRLEIEHLARRKSFGGIEPQGDQERSPVDLLAPSTSVLPEHFHPYFRDLLDNPSRAPARRVISEIAPWLYPADPHFVSEFQRHQFDQRLWELYLWAAFRELGFDVVQHEAPDFECKAPGINFTVEATTVSASQQGPLLDHPNPRTPEERNEFLNTYMPMKFGSTLTTKLRKMSAEGLLYWERPWSRNKPFVIALADFHKAADPETNDPASLTYSQGALYIYLYGHRVDWSMKDGKLHISTAPVNEHVYRDKTIPSGFFELPGAENISAVLFSNAGTIAKFDRMGVAAGFAAKGHRYFRMGTKFDPTPEAMEGQPFSVELIYPDYEEGWSDEIQVFHNPKAKYPLPPSWLPGLAHHFFEDGKLFSIDTEGRVLGSLTLVMKIIDGEDN